MSSDLGFLARGGMWVIGQAFVLGITVVAPFVWHPEPSWDGMPSFSVGCTLAALGTILAGAGLTQLGSSLTPLPHPRNDASLKQTGVYRLVRHPIYGGLILVAFGYCSLQSSPIFLLFGFAVLVFFDRKSRVEEKWLEERYDEYREYARHTKRFIPWLL